MQEIRLEVFGQPSYTAGSQSVSRCSGTAGIKEATGLNRVVELHRALALLMEMVAAPGADLIRPMLSKAGGSNESLAREVNVGKVPATDEFSISRKTVADAW